MGKQKKREESENRLVKLGEKGEGRQQRKRNMGKEKEREEIKNRLVKL